MPKYCECGNEIKIFLRGKFRTPKNDGHFDCMRCNRAIRDSFRTR